MGTRLGSILTFPPHRPHLSILSALDLLGNLKAQGNPLSLLILSGQTGSLRGNTDKSICVRERQQWVQHSLSAKATPGPCISRPTPAPPKTEV